MSAQPARTAGEIPVRIIRPASGWPFPKLRDAWERRELLLFFAVRDIKVRYAQTVLGVLWTIVQPLALVAVFTLAFRKVGNVQTGGLPYPVFALAGVTFWTLFARTISQGAESLVTNAHLLTKTAAPRLLIPLSSITSALFDFGIALAFFFAFAGVYGELASWQLLLLPAALSFGLLFSVGPVLLFSALNVRYRDVRHILPFLVQIWLFLSPIAYPISALGEPWSTIVALNPLVGIVDLFRWTLTGVDPPGAFELAAAGGITAVLLVGALAYFARAERTLADVA